MGKQFEAREKILELLATSYYHEKKWYEAKRFLVELLDYDMEEKLRLERMHTLAEICFAKGDLEDAKIWCTKAVQGRLTILGKRHYLFYQSVNFLAQIYDAKGEFVEAEGYKAVLAVLPPGLQGNTPLNRITNRKNVLKSNNYVISSMLMKLPNSLVKPISALFSQKNPNEKKFNEIFERVVVES